MKIDRLLRLLIPSAAHLSYNPFFKFVGNSLAGLLSLPFPEFRALPPNHLRVRVGVGNKAVNNQAYHLAVGRDYWFNWLSKGFCDDRSDIVEIGCGCGRIAHHLRGDWFEGSYLGVDIDSEQIDYCRRSFPADRFAFALSPHRSATYKAGDDDGFDRVDVGSLLGEENSKDFVFSTSLLTHLLEREIADYLTACHRVLRCEGRLFMTFFCLDYIQRGGRWTFNHKIGRAHCESFKYPEAAVAYDEATMIDMATSHGFTDVTVLPRSGQSVLTARKGSDGTT